MRTRATPRVRSGPRRMAGAGATALLAALAVLPLKPPAVDDGKALTLLFGAVDGDAELYLNGRKIGKHVLRADGFGWDTPFHFGSLVAAGTSNLIAVKCTTRWA